MTDLETEIENLKKQLRDLAERVRVDAVATEFLEQKIEYRDGDYVLVDSLAEAHRLRRAGAALLYSDGRGYERGITPADERLYTRAEVAEIVAKATTVKADDLAAEVQDAIATNPTLIRMVRALKDISNSTNPEYTIRRAREALGL